jgi:hypothetical protein
MAKAEILAILKLATERINQKRLGNLPDPERRKRFLDYPSSG